MHRRDLLAAGTAAALATTAAPAFASGGESKDDGPAHTNLSGVGLPVIFEGRLRNYVFVSVELTLGDDAKADEMRAKEPFIRDALVRAAHRAPFTLADDWTKVNELQVNAAVMAIAKVLVGEGKVTASRVVVQTPRRVTGIRSPSTYVEETITVGQDAELTDVLAATH